MNITTKNIVTKVYLSEEEKELFRKTGIAMRSCCDYYFDCGGCPFQDLFHSCSCFDVRDTLLNFSQM